MRQPCVRREQGFTLVELMITVVVIAVLLVIAVPSFAEMIDKSRLKGAANGVIDLINNARVESVKQSRSVNISFDGSTTAWCVGANAAVDPANPGDEIPDAAACLCDTAPTACTVSGTERVFDKASDNGIVLSAMPASVMFDSRLGTTLDPATKVLTTTEVTMTSPRKNFDLKLTVTPMGQVSLCVPSTSKRPIVGYSAC